MVVSGEFLLGRFDVKLCADNARDFHRLAAGDWRAFFRAGGGGVTRAADNIGDLADAIFTDGCDDIRHGPDQFAHMGFAGALRVAEDQAQKFI